MNSRKHLPEFVTLAEAKRFVWLNQGRQPDSRPGQAVSNLWSVPAELESKIYELTDIPSVALLLLHHSQAEAMADNLWSGS